MYTCKHCNTQSSTILVTSEATQKVNLETDSWEDLDIGDTLKGHCLTCGVAIPSKDLEQLLEHKPSPDYRDILERLVNDFESEGCEGCGTVSLELINEARKSLGIEELT